MFQHLLSQAALAVRHESSRPPLAVHGLLQSRFAVQDEQQAVGGRQPPACQVIHQGLADDLVGRGALPEAQDALDAVELDPHGQGDPLAVYRSEPMKTTTYRSSSRWGHANGRPSSPAGGAVYNAWAMPPASGALSLQPARLSSSGVGRKQEPVGVRHQVGHALPVTP